MLNSFFSLQDDSEMNASFDSTNSIEEALPSSQACRTLAPFPVTINNLRHPEYDYKDHEELRLIDVKAVDANCSPSRLFNDPFHVSIFLSKYLLPFICWSMIGNLAHWITTAGISIIDST